jgi:isoleucyl-tRNA synthetase
LQGHLLDELNVKAVEIARDEGSLVTYSLKPVFPKLGPKYGKQVPFIGQALAGLDAGVAAAKLKAGENVELNLDGETITLEPGEIEIMAAAREGLATAEEQGYVVGIQTELDDALIAEGMARDVVRLVQSLRKDSGLEITDRIQLNVAGDASLVAAVRTWSDFVAGETLALDIDFAEPGNDADGRVEAEVEGQAIRLGLKRAVS